MFVSSGAAPASSNEARTKSFIAYESGLYLHLLRVRYWLLRRDLLSTSLQKKP
ncbi:MAG: hypothetical protein ACJARU_001479, partial [Congregibacter sp.]